MIDDTLIHILGYELRQTCSVCPEQYDVFSGGVKVGYIRLRHGYFQVDIPTCGGTTVLEVDHVPGADGCFRDRTQRMQYLNEAVCVINEVHSKEQKGDAK